MSERTMSTETHNGWKNWETWETFNFLAGVDEYTYLEARDIARRWARPSAVAELRQLVKDATEGQDIDRRKIDYPELVQALREE